MSEQKKSWFSTGYEPIDAEKERLARLSGPQRFWMKEGTKRKICFIDDEPFNVHEHNPKLNGSWKNQFTCIKDFSDMVVCCEKLGERSRYYVGYYTIVDLTESTDEKNAKYKYEVKLLPTKLKTLQLMRRKKQDRGSLIGCIFNVARDTQDDPNCGNEYEFERQADLAKLVTVASFKGRKLLEYYKEATEKPDVLQRMKDTFQASLKDGQIVPQIYSFNYQSVLAPKTPQEIRAILGGHIESTGGANEDDADKTEKDDNVPF